MKKQEIATPIKPKHGEVNGKIADSQATKRKKYGGESKTCVISVISHQEQADKSYDYFKNER